MTGLALRSVPGLHLLRLAGRCCGAAAAAAAAGLLAELHQRLVVLLLLLLLLLVAGQDEEEAQDAFQVAIPDLCRDPAPPPKLKNKEKQMQKHDVKTLCTVEYDQMSFHLPRQSMNKRASVSVSRSAVEGRIKLFNFALLTRSAGTRRSSHEPM